jgi:hypothetical protein
MTVEIVVIPDPNYIDWQGWADTVAGYNPGVLQAVDPELSWRDFAHQFCQVVEAAPHHDLFTDWQDWAAAVKLALQV